MSENVWQSCRSKHCGHASKRRPCLATNPASLVAPLRNQHRLSVLLQGTYWDIPIHYFVFAAPSNCCRHELTAHPLVPTPINATVNSPHYHEYWWYPHFLDDPIRIGWHWGTHHAVRWPWPSAWEYVHCVLWREEMRDILWPKPSRRRGVFRRHRHNGSVTYQSGPLKWRRHYHSIIPCWRSWLPACHYSESRRSVTGYDSVYLAWLSRRDRHRLISWWLHGMLHWRKHDAKVTIHDCPMSKRRRY